MDRRKQTTYKRRSAEYGGRTKVWAETKKRGTQTEQIALARQERKFTRTKRSILVVVGLLVLFIGGGATYAQLGPSIGQSSTTGVYLQKGLIGWWKLDGNVNDASPYRTASSMTFGRTPVYVNDYKGTTNKAQSYNGSNDSLNLSKDLFPKTDFTISVWASSTNLSKLPIFGGFDAGGGVFPRITTATPAGSGNAILEFNDSAKTNFFSLSLPGLFSGLNQWAHYSFVKNGSAVRVYKNGQLFASGTTSANRVYTAPTGFSIGYNGNYFQGNVDDFRVYDRAINANEAKALYVQYNPSTNIASGEKGLAGWWKLDGNSNDSTPWRRTSSRNSATLVPDRKATANSAYSIGGSSLNGIYIDSDSPTDPLTSFNELTMSAWVKFDNAPSAAGQFRTVVYKRAAFSTNTPGFAMYWSNANNNIAVDMGASGSDRWNTGYTPTVGEWTHLAYTYSGGTGRLYVNGTQFASTSTIGSLTRAQTQSALALGKTTTNTGNYAIGGTLDDVRLYTRALSANDINTQYKSYNSQISINSNSNNVNTSTGLVGYWPFNGNANDSTPYRNNAATISSVLTSDRQGISNKAYSFNGTNQQIAINNTSTLNPTKAFTISTWVNGILSGGVAGVVSKDQGGTVVNPPYSIEASAGTYIFRLTASDNSSRSITCSGFSDNVWYFVAGTFDGTTARLYVNGSLCGTAASIAFSSVAPTSGQLRFGQQKSGFNRWFNGKIDDVRLYNRALAQQDINALYSDYR